MRDRIREILGTAAAIFLWTLGFSVTRELDRSLGGVIGFIVEVIGVIGFWILGCLLGGRLVAWQNRRRDPNRYLTTGRIGADGAGKHRAVEFSELLTFQLYLLAYDMRKQKLQRAGVEYLLRAAALTDLQFQGRVGNQPGNVYVSSPEPVGEQVLDAVLQNIVGSRSRSWQDWIGPEYVGFGEGVFERAVRDRFAALGVVELKRRRILGVFSSTRILVYQPQIITQLTTRIHDTLVASVIDPHDAALVALAAAGGLNNVLPRRSRRMYKTRIAELAERTGPAVFALRNVKSSVNVVSALGPLAPGAIATRGHRWPSPLI